MRNVVSLNRKWAFTMDASVVPSAMPAPAYFVNVPHSFNAIDGQDGAGDYHRGLCYYVKNLSYEDLPEGEKLYLEIQGANSSADLYVGGKHLAHHDGGYSTWRVDVTGEINRTGDTLIVIGVDNEHAGEVMRELYHTYVRNTENFIVMDIASAEMTKYAANAMLATKISFINEISNICERVGADVNKVRLGIGSDSPVDRVRVARP